jgi:hypothetical protein
VECTTYPGATTPRGALPLKRARLVLTAVSSRNTSLAGSSMPCSRIQRRRARATSARCRSAACKLFFEGDVVPIEETPQRTAAGSNSLLAQDCHGLYQSQMRLFGNHSQNLRRALFQRRNASSARLRGDAPTVAQRCNHLTAELALTSKRSAGSRRDAPISTALITRSRSSREQAFGIPSPRKGESMRQDSLIHRPLGIPFPTQIARVPL